MMKFDLERIYSLLPAIHRLRDYQQIEGKDETPPLKSLLSIIAEEVEFLEENIDQLYDDYFIETCAEWVIPYIGELIGSDPLIPIKSAKFSSRAEVANTIGYRRRKGTLSVVEQLAKDITNWDANVVEYFKLLATTQYLNHLRPENSVFPTMKNWEHLEYVNTPFDIIPKSADVRNIGSGRGKYNIPNIGIFLWRIGASSRKKSVAFRISDLRYTFHSLGVDTPLYNFPKAETTISQLAEPQNMPVPFQRRLLKINLADHYGPEGDIFLRIGSNRNIMTNEICIGDLSNWENLAVNPPNDIVVIDPAVGRIMFGADFSTDLASNDLYVWYHYGSLNLVGGGEYFRKDGFTDIATIITVSKDAGIADFTTIQEAIAQAQIDATNTVIEILDNETYNETLTISLQPGQSLEIRSIDGKQATLIFGGDTIITGNVLADLTLNGLMIDSGNIVVQTGEALEKLMVKHSIIRPSNEGNKIFMQSATHLEVVNSIIAGVETVAGCKIHIENSIVDVLVENEKAITGAEGELANLTIVNSTVRGGIAAKSVDLIENSVLISPLTVSFLQTGCIRFSYLPTESVTPRKYNCYPKNDSEGLSVAPFFQSTVFGNAAYFQHHRSANKIFLQGADDTSEIGVYHDLFQIQKETNLRMRLNEYIRFGMEAGIFYAS